MTDVEVWTIRKILDWSINFLKDRGSPSARLDAELLLAQALSCSRLNLYTSFDKPLNPKERVPFKELLLRRAQGEPIAYILGFKEFMGMSFKVNKDVLIPRPDTEILVEQAINFLQSRSHQSEHASKLKALDIGTGSGCIALSIAKQVPSLWMIAWDISNLALKLAEENQRNLDVPQVNFNKCDALQPETWDALEPNSFDLIISNPPYIAMTEETDLPISVKQFEPHIALFIEDGLTFYRTIAKRASVALKPNGKIMVEIGSTQAASVSALFSQAGWKDIQICRDYAQNDRVVTATCPN